MTLNAIRFKYTADLRSDRDLQNCYALVTFIAKGSIGTYLHEMDDLRVDTQKREVLDFEEFGIGTT